MTIAKEIAALEQIAVSELVRRYEEVCGEPVRSRNRAYLIRRIAWRLQANNSRHAAPRRFHRQTVRSLRRLRHLRPMPEMPARTRDDTAFAG